MRHDDVGGQGDTGSVGGIRANALWGSKRTLPLILTALSVAALALGGGRVQAAQAPRVDAYVSPGLLAKAEENQAALFDVIVQARENGKSSDVAAEIADVRKSDPASGTKLKRQFFSIAGTSATLSGRQLLKLAKRGRIESVVEDARTGATYSNSQKWVGATEVLESSTDAWNASYGFPAIAIVVPPPVVTVAGRRLPAQGARVTELTTSRMEHDRRALKHSRSSDSVPPVGGDVARAHS